MASVVVCLGGVNVVDAKADAEGRQKPLVSGKRPVPYVYPGYCVRVIDGDTIVCDLDMGHNVWRRKAHVRLLGIDTPEMRGEERDQGREAKALVEAMLKTGDEVLVLSSSLDSFGRLLGIVWIGEAQKSLNQWLIEKGYANNKHDSRPS